MEFKYSYKLTQKAINDYNEIASYIAVQLDNKPAATKFADKLENCIEEACLFLESGSLVDNEFVSGFGIRKKIVDNYIMYYLPKSDDKIVLILSIVYGRRNMDDIFKFMGI